MGIFLIILCLAIIFASINKMIENSAEKSPAEKQQEWIKEFVDTTPLDEIYPVSGSKFDKISFGSDKVADALGIDTYEAAKLLHAELSRREFPHEAPPEIQRRVDCRIKEDLERWKNQIHEYADTVPPDEYNDPVMSLEHQKEIVKRFSVPKRISGTFWRDELYTRSDAHKQDMERKRRIQEETACYQHLTFKVVGVTFKNGRRSRQTILRQIRFQDPPYDETPEIWLQQYEYEGEPAFSVWANDEQVGNIGRGDIPQLLGLWDQYDAVTDFSVYGGGEGRSYGMEITVRFKKKAGE